MNIEKFSYSKPGLVYPIIYCVYTLIRGSFVGWYPYYFLSPIKMHSYEGVELSVLGLAAFFVVIILSVYCLHNRLAKLSPCRGHKKTII